MKHSSRVAQSILLCLCATAATAASPSYAVIDLGVQLGGEGLMWQGQVSTLTPAGYPQLPGASGSIFSSNSRYAVGSSRFGDDETHATRWNIANPAARTVTDLGVLGLSPGSPPFSQAYGVNQEGEVVGVTNTENILGPNTMQTASHGFFWRDGVMNDLGAIAGPGYFSSAEGINDSHEIVGWTSTISSITGEVLKRAFVYIGGTTYNLTFFLVGGPTVLLSDAVSIDCQGNIAALGTPAGGSRMHSYLLVRQGAARTCLK